MRPQKPCRPCVMRVGASVQSWEIESAAAQQSEMTEINVCDRVHGSQTHFASRWVGDPAGCSAVIAISLSSSTALSQAAKTKGGGEEMHTSTKEMHISTTLPCWCNTEDRLCRDCTRQTHSVFSRCPPATRSLASPKGKAASPSRCAKGRPRPPKRRRTRKREASRPPTPARHGEVSTTAEWHHRLTLRRK